MHKLLVSLLYTYGFLCHSLLYPAGGKHADLFGTLQLWRRLLAWMVEHSLHFLFSIQPVRTTKDQLCGYHSSVSGFPSLFPSLKTREAWHGWRQSYSCLLVWCINRLTTLLHSVQTGIFLELHGIVSSVNKYIFIDIQYTVVCSCWQPWFRTAAMPVNISSAFIGYTLINQLEQWIKASRWFTLSDSFRVRTCSPLMRTMLHSLIFCGSVFHTPDTADNTQKCAIDILVSSKHPILKYKNVL